MLNAPSFCWLTIVAALAVTSCKIVPQYQLADRPLETRVEDLLGRLVLDEKLDLLTGTSWMDAAGNQKYGIPQVHMARGSSGVADWNSPAQPAAQPATATAFPAGIALAATFDPDLAEKIGHAIGREARSLGRDQLLGPALDINRNPLSGVTFEGYGEDPLLTSRMGVSFIRGVQAEGVIATAMHLALNVQEEGKRMLNIVTTERTLEEIYLPAIDAAVREGKVWSVMTSGNRLNGTWATDNERLLLNRLKKDWDFRGFVVSEWGTTHTSSGPVNGGTDLEMPGPEAVTKWQTFLDKQSFGNHGVRGGFLANDRVAPEISHAVIRQDSIDEMLRRRFRAQFAVGMFDRKAATTPAETPEHLALARTAAAQSIVLLKNTGALPLDSSKIRSLAVIGPSAAVARTGGGGGSAVTPKSAVAPLAGIKERAGAAIKVDYALGVPMNGESGTADIASAVALARRSDAAIVFVGDSAAIEREGADRKSLNLPAGQDDLIAAVSAANRNTVVVVIAGSVVAMNRWAAGVNAIVMAWFPGQEGGHAIADVLFGDVNASGKLPLTFPREAGDISAARFSEIHDSSVELGEGIFVGYRHFDKENIEPLFPFGHGLSYTRFEYGALTAPPRVETGKKIPVTLTVKNTGTRAGAEVVQFYITETKPRLERPPRELKAFRRIETKPGEATTVTLELDQKSLQYYDQDRHRWITQPGEYEIAAGSSSRDLRSKAKFELVIPPPPPRQPPIGSMPPKTVKKP